MAIRAPSSIAGQSQLDADSKAMIYGGLSVSNLAVLFGVDHKTLGGKIRDVAPCGTRAGFPIYKVKEVAPYLTRPKGDMEEYIRRMNPRDIPPILQKEFWNGQNARLKYEEAEADVWPTEQVVEYFGSALQAIRMALLTMTDNIERESALTDVQRTTMKRIADSALEQMRVSLTEGFLKRAEEERATRLKQLEETPLPGETDGDWSQDENGGL